MLEICVGDSTWGTIRFGLKKDKETLHIGYDLDFGPIPRKNFWKTRADWYKSIFPSFGGRFLVNERRKIKRILACAKKHGAMRFWLSSAANVTCAFYFFVWLLQGYDCDIFVLNMPQGAGFREKDAENVWGEVNALSLREFLPLTRELSSKQRDEIAAKWEHLQEENAELRIRTDRGIESVPVDYFDDEILSYMPDEECSMAKLVGMTIGRSKRSLSDAFVTERIYSLIDRKKLILTKPSSKKYRSYMDARVRKA